MRKEKTDDVDTQARGELRAKQWLPPRKAVVARRRRNQPLARSGQDNSDDSERTGTWEPWSI